MLVHLEEIWASYLWDALKCRLAQQNGQVHTRIHTEEKHLQIVIDEKKCVHSESNQNRSNKRNKKRTD